MIELSTLFGRWIADFFMFVVRYISPTGSNVSLSSFWVMVVFAIRSSIHDAPFRN